MSCGCPTNPQPAASNAACCDVSQRGGATWCEDRFANLARSRRIRLFGADGTCMREFPQDSVGLPLYDGNGGAIVTNRPQLKLPTLENYARNPSTGALLLDASGNPIKDSPPPFEMLMVQDSLGFWNTWKGPENSKGALTWNGYQFSVVAQNDCEDGTFDELAQQDAAEEIVAVRMETSSVVSGLCERVPVWKLARRNPSLKSIVESADQGLQGQIDLLKAQISALSSGDSISGGIYSRKKTAVHDQGVGAATVMNFDELESTDSTLVESLSGDTQFKILLDGNYLIQFGGYGYKITGDTGTHIDIEVNGAIVRRNYFSLQTGPDAPFLISRAIYLSVDDIITNRISTYAGSGTCRWGHLNMSIIKLG